MRFRRFLSAGAFLVWFTLVYALTTGTGDSQIVQPGCNKFNPCEVRSLIVDLTSLMKGALTFDTSQGAACTFAVCDRTGNGFSTTGYYQAAGQPSVSPTGTGTWGGDPAGGGIFAGNGTVDDLEFKNGSGTVECHLIHFGSELICFQLHATNGFIAETSFAATGLIHPSDFAAVQGNAAAVQLASGSHTTGHQLVYDASGNAIDGGAPAGGSVTTTGSPANGNLAKFSGPASITNGDLSGDCTTSATLATTCTKTGGTPFAPSATTDTTNANNISSGTLGQARLPTGILRCGVEWPSDLTVTADTHVCMVALVSGTIDSVSAYTGGTGSPSFTYEITINGTAVTSCNGVTVTTGVLTTTCTGANTFTSGQKVEIVIASIGGTPDQAIVQVNWH